MYQAFAQHHSPTHGKKRHRVCVLVEDFHSDSDSAMFSNTSFATRSFEEMLFSDQWERFSSNWIRREGSLYTTIL